MDLFDHHLDLPEGGALRPRDLPAHGGVYLICDVDDRPILLACGESLRRAVINRLAGPSTTTTVETANDEAMPQPKSRRMRLGEIARRIHWRETFSRFETSHAHWQAARQIDPRRYRDTLTFGPVWFLRADPTERLPRFTVHREIRSDAAAWIGIFPTRRSADEWVHMLEDLFDLCRYYHILEQAPHGQACAYFEMGRCPAPCDGHVPLSHYQDAIREAIAYCRGDRETRPATLDIAMRAAAGDLAFEKAASIRTSIERVAAAQVRDEYSHVAGLEHCNWLIVQRAGPARRTQRGTTVRPYFVRAGRLAVGDPVSLADIDDAADAWIQRCRMPPSEPASGDDDTSRSELMWLVARYLFQGDRAPGLFYRFDRLPEAQGLAGAVRDRFATADKPVPDTANPPAGPST